MKKISPNELIIYSLFFTLPFFKPNYYSIFLVIAAVYCVVTSSKESFKAYISNIYRSNLIYLILYFTIFILGLIYSSDTKLGLFEIEKHIPLLAFPLLTPILLSSSLSANVRIHALLSFIYGNIFTLITCFIDAAISNFNFNGFEEVLPGFFTYHELIKLYDLHATYFGLYLNFSLIILYYLFTTEKIISKYTFFSIMILFLIAIGLLQARIIYLSTLLSIVLVPLFFQNSPSSKPKYFNWAFIIVILLFVFSNIILNKTLNKRIVEMIEFKQTDLMGSNSENGITQRIFIWTRAWEAVKAKPVIGYGTGGDRFGLYSSINNFIENNKDLNKGQVEGIQSIISVEYNAHNQFLTDLLMFGLVGGWVIIFILFQGFLTSIKRNNMLQFGFMLAISLACLTEVILVRQKGIVFFSLFYCFLFYESKENMTIKKEATALIHE
jgi:O-antigen ligase